MDAADATNGDSGGGASVSAAPAVLVAAGISMDPSAAAAQSNRDAAPGAQEEANTQERADTGGGFNPSETSITVDATEIEEQEEEQPASVTVVQTTIQTVANGFGAVATEVTMETAAATTTSVAVESVESGTVPEAISNGATGGVQASGTAPEMSNGTITATETAANGTTTAAPSTNGSESAVPPKPRKMASIGAPRRLRSGSGSGGSNSGTTVSAVFKRSGRERTSSGNGPIVATGGGGIVVGSIRRRHRTGLSRQESSEDDEGLAVASADAAAKKAVKPAKKLTAQRQPSLRNVATLVRTNIRNSVREKASENGGQANNGDGNNNNNNNNNGSATALERKGSATFANVAHQVVTSKRAAKGFISMWAKDSNAVTHVYKGLHMEKKKLDLKTVASEYKEIKRRQFYQELLVYLVFLTLFFSTLAWLPVQESYEQNDVVGSITCREEGVCELKKFGDIYEFAATLAEHICDKKGVTSQWVRVGGVRFRQVRVKQQQCKVYNGWYTPCYPFYDEDTEEKSPIQGQEGRVYKWHDGLGPLQPELYHSVFEMFSSLESYGNGGYAVDLCQVKVEDLQEDDWLSVSTRALSFEFTLVNPVTRVFTVGLHVFTMSPSGHMEHYPHSSHLRVIGLEENEVLDEAAVQEHHQSTHAPHARRSVFNIFGWVLDIILGLFSAFDHRILLWIGLILFFITYSIGEATEMSTMGASSYLRLDMWNVFELSHLVLLAFILVYMARFYMASSTFAKDLSVLMSGKAAEEIDHSSMQVLLRNFQRLSDVASLASAVSLLKVFKFLRMNSTLNLLWRVLGMAIRDLMGFLVIFNLIFLGYSAMGSYAFGFALEEFSTIGKSYGTCFQMLAGEMDYGRLSQANPRLAPVFIGTFVVLVFQILVNMFVAILSEYYEVAKNDDGSEEDVEYDVLTRLRNYLRACAPTVVANKNEVIRLIPKQAVRLISTNLVDQEETRQRAKKLFRGAVWRVVALLRFGMKFDRRIQFGDRKNHAHLGSGNEKKDSMVTHIRLSENFDHKTIKEMIPIGIKIRLKGDSLLGDGIALKVVRHNKLSVECVVLDNEEGATNAGGRRNPRKPISLRSLSASSSFDESDFDIDLADHPPRERVLELLGGEKLRIPWQIFAFHVFRSFLKEVRMGLLRAIKLWNYSKSQLVDDYHLGLLFESVRADGRSSLRFDEVYRMLDLYLRKDKKKSLCTQAEVRQEALQVMYRFRKCLIDMPSREKEGHNYRPKPVDTSTVELGQLEYLGDMLARNCHDMWALERLKQGWVYGAQRDDAKKKHPNLIPYKLLSPDEQAFDYRSSLETLKSIVFMNYTIVRLNHSGSFQDAMSLSRSPSMMSDILDGPGQGTSTRALFSSTSNVGASGSIAENGGAETNGVAETDSCPAIANASASLTPSEPKGKKPVPTLLREAMSFRRNSLMEDSPYFTTYGENNAEVYRPLPIDTSSVELPPRLLRLVDLLSENAHEVWAKGRMDEGWTYGPQRDDESKKHPCLVPYIFLTDEEKEYDLNIAKETLKTLLAMKFTLVDRSSKY